MKSIQVSVIGGTTANYSTGNVVLGTTTNGLYNTSYPSLTAPLWDSTPNKYLDELDVLGLFLRAWQNNPPLQKLPKELCSSSYPPADIYEDSDENYIVELCVAGYKEDDIEIEFEEDHLYLALKDLSDKDSKKHYLQKGIRRSKNESSYFVPFEKYDVDNAKATLNEGILKIVVPMKEEAKPKKVKITTTKG